MLFDIFALSHFFFLTIVTLFAFKMGVRRVWDKWPKSNYQNFKSTQWFSYKIRTKKSLEPIVYLHNWPLPEQNSLFEYTMGNPFFDFFKYWQKGFNKKIRIEIWTFSFQICFLNQFSTSGSGQTENTQLRVFAYF